MRSWLAGAGICLALTIGAGAAQADDGFVTANVNLRSGPSTAYPPVAVLQAGTPLEVFGCLQDISWCDVNWNGYRGWVSGRYIEYVYRGRRVVLPDYAPTVGVPIVTFNFDDYWGRYYRGRSWYSTYDRWGPPPPRRGPPPYYPPPGPGPGYPPPGGPGWGGPGYPPPGGPGWGGGPPPQGYPPQGRPPQGGPPPQGYPPPNYRPPQGGPPPQGYPPPNYRPPQGGPPPQQGRPPQQRPPQGGPPPGPPPQQGQPPQGQPQQGRPAPRYMPPQQGGNQQQRMCPSGVPCPPNQ